MTIKIGANLRIHRLGISVCIIIFILLYFYAIREPSSLPFKVEENENSLSLSSLLKSSIKAAEIGGMEIIHVHENMKIIGIEIKGKTKEGIDDPVTLADYKSHCAMYNYLSKTFPSITVISEEKSKNCDDTAASTPNVIEDDEILKVDVENYEDSEIINPEDITVWIDPLDATKEFTENLLNYVTTMVCVAVKGIPVIGVIHKPFGHKETWWAWSKHGYSKNLAENKIKREEKLSVPILIVSRSHAGKVHNASKIAIGENVQIISAGGAGYKSLEVLAGNATAYVHMTAIKKWDVCAGAAIINALGGTVTSLSGDEMNNFGSTDSMVLEHGLLATMNDHSWYLDKFHHM